MMNDIVLKGEKLVRFSDVGYVARYHFHAGIELDSAPNKDLLLSSANQPRLFSMFSSEKFNPTEKFGSMDEAMAAGFPTSPYDFTEYPKTILDVLSTNVLYGGNASKLRLIKTALLQRALHADKIAFGQMTFAYEFLRWLFELMNFDSKTIFDIQLVSENGRLITGLEKINNSKNMSKTQTISSRFWAWTHYIENPINFLWRPEVEGKVAYINFEMLFEYVNEREKYWPVWGAEKYGRFFKNSSSFYLLSTLVGIPLNFQSLWEQSIWGKEAESVALKSGTIRSITEPFYNFVAGSGRTDEYKNTVLEETSQFLCSCFEWNDTPVDLRAIFK